MIALITISATILLLWILLYPTIIRLYRIFNLGKEQMDKEKNESSDKPIILEKEVSIIGKSNFSLSQPVPTTTTPIAKEPDIDKAVPNFVPEENQEPMAIDVPLEKEIIEDGETNEEEEAIELEELFGEDVQYASGVDINDLGKLKYVIETPSAETEEKKQAGKILYENKETGIVEQMVSGNEKTASIISNLIDLHMTSFLKEKGAVNNNQEKVSDELNDFDVNQFLNPK